jgi:hypothetical protein
VLCVPLEVAAEVPRVAAELLASEKELIDFCRSPTFSFDLLAAKIQSVSRKAGVPDMDPKS